VKKITAILFLTMYLFYATGFSELLKLNTLIDHFHETKQNDSAITFSQFLLMHYITDDHNDRDDERDRQLPFRSTDTHTSGNSTFYFSSHNIQISSVRTFTVRKPAKMMVKDLLIETGFNAIVWHPPKVS